MRQTKIYFKTDQGKEINSIVKAYVERVMGPKKEGEEGEEEVAK